MKRYAMLAVVLLMSAGGILVCASDETIQSSQEILATLIGFWDTQNRSFAEPQVLLMQSNGTFRLSTSRIVFPDTENEDIVTDVITGEIRVDATILELIGTGEQPDLRFEYFLRSDSLLLDNGAILIKRTGA